MRSLKNSNSNQRLAKAVFPPLPSFSWQQAGLPLRALLPCGSLATRASNRALWREHALLYRRLQGDREKFTVNPEAPFVGARAEELMTVVELKSLSPPPQERGYYYIRQVPPGEMTVVNCWTCPLNLGHTLRGLSSQSQSMPS